MLGVSSLRLKQGARSATEHSHHALQSGVLDSFPFDPLGQNSEAMQLREIKNGRLAMVRVPRASQRLQVQVCWACRCRCGWCWRHHGILQQLTLSLYAWQVAFVGFAVQALVTREQPIEGLNAHLADPFGHNIITCGTCCCSDSVASACDLHTGWCMQPS